MYLALCDYDKWRFAFALLSLCFCFAFALLLLCFRFAIEKKKISSESAICVRLDI